METGGDVYGLEEVAAIYNIDTAEIRLEDLDSLAFFLESWMNLNVDTSENYSYKIVPLEQGDNVIYIIDTEDPCIRQFSFYRPKGGREWIELFHSDPLVVERARDCIGSGGVASDRIIKENLILGLLFQGEQG